MKPIELANEVYNRKIYTSQSALARAARVSESTMRKFLKDNCIETVPGRIITCEGVRYAKLVEKEDIKFVLEYFNYPKEVDFNSRLNNSCALLR